MKKLILSLPLLLLGAIAFGQTTFIYCSGGSGSYQSGWTDGVTRYDDTIRCTGTTKGGYAVFDLTSIPAGSIISSVTLVFYTNGLMPGTAGTCNTYGYNGDLSLVTDPATLFSDLTSGTLLASGTGSAPGGYGITGSDSIAIVSTAAPFTSFITSNIGGKASICFTGGGTNEYSINGYGVFINPHLKITYAAPCAGTPSCGYITASNTLACSTLTTTLTNTSIYDTWGNSFQWQSSPDSTTWTNIAGATNQIYNNTGITATTYFRNVVTCSVSGLSGYSAGKKLTYAPCCSGMPTPAAATASTTFCDGCLLTLNIPGYTPQAGLTDQWQYSVDSITWSNTPWYTPLPTTVPCNVTNMGAFYYRDMQTCSIGGGLTAFSPGVFVGFPYSFTELISQPFCYNPTFTASIHGWAPNLYVKTMYGDGTYDSVHATTDSIGSYVQTVHHYPFPGGYSTKCSLYNNNVWIQDKISYIIDSPCYTTGYYFFHDANANCVRDSEERPSTTPLQLAIDSNGIAIDTITATSGFNYSVHGPIGTIYTFTSLNPTTLFCSGTNVLSDTVSISSFNEKLIGVHCSSSSVYDFSFSTLSVFTRGRHMAKYIFPSNAFCSSVNANVTVTFSPKYTFVGEAFPSPTLVSGNTLMWDIGAFGFLDTNRRIYWQVENNPVSGNLFAGDTVHTCVTITPIAGDLDPSNNTECVIDTVTSSYDPNEMFVSPSYCLPSDTSNVPLKYTINFTNVGNDTAFNIYVLDTLPDFVDPMSMKIIAATDSMFTTRLKLGGHNVVKFDFPGINLPDTAQCSWCSGGVSFGINLVPNLPDGTTITNRAGVYFDYNPVCMTNSVTNVTGCWVNGVGDVTNPQTVRIYPNPATCELNITIGQLQYHELTVTNSMGQTLLKQNVGSNHTLVDIGQLSPGLYFVTLSGESGNETYKFVKM